MTYDIVVPGIVVLVYGAGFLVTWVLAARFWVKSFGRGGAEQIAGGVWGLLIAILWPLFAVGALVGKLGSL